MFELRIEGATAENDVEFFARVDGFTIQLFQHGSNTALRFTHYLGKEIAGFR